MCMNHTISIQGKIESETWAGVTKGAEILEEYFRNVDKSIDAVVNNRDTEATKDSNIKQGSLPKLEQNGIDQLQSTISSENLKVLTQGMVQKKEGNFPTQRGAFIFLHFFHFFL